MSARPIVATGALPYTDGSGYGIDIVIDPPSERYPFLRLRINPDSEFFEFDIDEWPDVRAAIDLAVQAAQMLRAGQMVQKNG